MSTVIGTVTGILTFAGLTALALPRLETSLTFIPVLLFSVLAGGLAAWAVAAFQKGRRG